MTETNLYVLVVTLSTQDNVKLLSQLNRFLKGQSVGIFKWNTRIIKTKSKFKSFS